MPRRLRLTAVTRWPRRLLVAVAVSALAVAGLLTVAAAPAAAHGQFVSSDPANGTTVGMPLASIVLYFTEKPTSNAFIAVTTASGARVDRLWSHGTPRQLDTPVHEYYHDPDGVWEVRSYSTVYPALVPIAYWPETGTYKVTFLSVATDGEPVRGEFTFTYSGAVTTAPADFRAQKNEPDPNLLAVAKTDAPTAPPSAGPAESDSSVTDSGPGVWIVLIPVVLAMVVALAMLGYWRWRPQQARELLVRRFGGRYAAAPPPRKPLQLPTKIQKRLKGKLPPTRRP